MLFDARTMSAVPQVLRPYQVEAVAAIESAWESHQRVLLVMATGLGKTTVFTHMARRRADMGGRVMVLVDRIELADQAIARLREFGINPAVEIAGERADESPYSTSPVVVSTVQTQRSGRGDYRRRDRFDPAQFSMLIVDEAHLSITPGTRETIAHYCRNPDLRVLGVTATPDRHDGRSLKIIYEHLAYRYDLIDAIRDGWLVPVHGRNVILPDLDVSNLDDRNGDFDPDELGAMLERNEVIYKTVATLSELPPGESTLVFCARVAHAEMVCQLLNEHRPSCAAVVSGDTPDDLRRQYIEAFRRGDIQYLCNCAVLTTGFDAPTVRCVAMVRPTRSRALYAQCVGRGTRPLPGLVDDFDTPEDRISAIMESPKKRLTVLNFVGVGGGVDLIGPEDVLAGDTTPPEVVRRAKREADRGEEMDVTERLQRAEHDEEEEERRRRHRIAGLKTAPNAVYKDVDLFKRGGGAVGTARWSRLHDALTSRQIEILHKGGLTDSEIAKMGVGEARRMVDWVIRRWRCGLCSWKQWKLLRARGVNADGMTKQEASAAIDEIAAREAWRRKA